MDLCCVVCNTVKNVRVKQEIYFDDRGVASIGFGVKDIPIFDTPNYKECEVVCVFCPKCKLLYIE